jgi:hypothetical protein
MATADVWLTMNSYAHGMPVPPQEAADLTEAFLVGTT